MKYAIAIEMETGMAEITLRSIRENADLRHLPILTLDERWYHLVPEEEKTDYIRKLETKVNDYLKKQGQINNDIKEVKKIKAKLIQDVVDNMVDDDTNPKRDLIMQESQRLIHEAKAKINSLEDESIDVPRQLAKANQELMLATVRFCYERLNDNRSDIEILDKWINDTRVKLKKNLLIKQDKETMNENMYTYMHDILGAEVMSAIDRVNET